jgi:hypothetical protein
MNTECAMRQPALFIRQAAEAGWLYVQSTHKSFYRPKSRFLLSKQFHKAKYSREHESSNIVDHGFVNLVLDLLYSREPSF